MLCTCSTVTQVAPPQVCGMMRPLCQEIGSRSSRGLLIEYLFSKCFGGVRKFGDGALGFLTTMSYKCHIVSKHDFTDTWIVIDLDWSWFTSARDRIPRPAGNLYCASERKCFVILFNCLLFILHVSLVNYWIMRDSDISAF